MALVSLLVLNYNGKKFLETVLPSIERQTFRDFEVILIDNGSTDDSEEYVRINFPKVKIFSIKPNVGYSRGVNIGFEQATSDMVVLITNDNRLDEHCIENLVRAYNHDPSGFYSTRNMDYYHPNEIDDVGGVNNILGYPIALGHHEPMVPEYNQVREVFAFCGNIFMASRKLFLGLGGFDVAHFSYLEDSDLSWRARLSGYRCYCVGDAVSYHMLSATWGRDSNKKKYLVERNRLFMINKNFSKWTIVRLMPLILSFDLFKSLFFLVSRNFVDSWIVLKAYIWNIAHLHVVIRRRRTVQRLRVVSDREILSFLETYFSGGSYLGTKHKRILDFMRSGLSFYRRYILGVTEPAPLSKK